MLPNVAMLADWILILRVFWLRSHVAALICADSLLVFWFFCLLNSVFCRLVFLLICCMIHSMICADFYLCLLWKIPLADLLVSCEVLCRFEFVTVSAFFWRCLSLTHKEKSQVEKLRHNEAHICWRSLMIFWSTNGAHICWRSVGEIEAK